MSMQIQLNQRELEEILNEKFPGAAFVISYTEPDEVWEGRTGKKIIDQMTPPEKETYVFYLGK